jgi:hypothetical protein
MCENVGHYRKKTRKTGHFTAHTLIGVEMNLFSRFVFHKGSTGALTQQVLLWPLIYRLATC